jgi:hypothetical protein
MEIVKKWQRAELLIFTILTIINMLPFVATRFFPSLDGASHLSNSNIINQLLFYNNEIFHQFFRINPEPVPNWTAHLLISLLTLVLPVFLAEKILIAILLIGIPFAFRTLLQTISPKNTLYSFLIFPFTHSMFFFFGFFNFCMAILLFLITLNYWLRHEHTIWKAKQIAILTLLIAVTYFSHIVIFGTLLLTIAIQIITTAILSFICKRNEKRFLLMQFIKKTLAITLAAIVPILLFAYFFFSRPEIRDIKFLSRQELVTYLVTLRPLVSFNPFLEGRQTTILFYLFVMLAGIGFAAFIFRLLQRFTKSNDPVHEQNPRLFPQSNFWWLLSSMTVLLVMYFQLPDSFGTASYTNLRIGFIFFLLTILWISTFRIPWHFGLIAAIAGLYVNTRLMRYYTPAIIKHAKLAAACHKAADFVAPNSLVLPIYCMEDWFTGHFVDYIAIDKPIVMVYNYECESGYFPVKWNEKTRPNFYLGNPATPEKYINYQHTRGNPFLRLDYVFIVGRYDKNTDYYAPVLDRIITEDFTKVYQAENCKLYRNKSIRIK